MREETPFLFVLNEKQTKQCRWLFQFLRRYFLTIICKSVSCITITDQLIDVTVKKKKTLCFQKRLENENYMKSFQIDQKRYFISLNIFVNHFMKVQIGAAQNNTISWWGHTCTFKISLLFMFTDQFIIVINLTYWSWSTQKCSVIDQCG